MSDISRSTFNREKHYSGVRMQQGRVQLDADWNEQLDIQKYIDQTTRQDVVGPCGAPKQNAGFVMTIDPEEGLPVIGKGRYYVDGILCENEQNTLITAQPDLPGFNLPESPEEHGIYLAYLDAWERHITALEDPDIREVALGGPDTTTRTKAVWQVKLEKIGSLGADVNCSQFAPGWLPAEPRSTGMLRARARREAASDDPCILSPQAGFRRLENQLYRVEIHDGGEVATGAAFKWSRDNGSIVTRLEKPIEGKILTVSDSASGGRLQFAPGQWVELSDERRVLHGEPGVLVQLAAVENKQLTVVEFPNGNAPELDPRTATVRRWDSVGAIPVSTEDYLDLEDGVQVNFLDGRHYRSGDYWMIPARTSLGDVLWPKDETSAESLFRIPHGTEHHYCALTLLQFDGTWTILQNGDCRRIFPALTEPMEQEPGIRITNILVKDTNDVDTPLRNDTEVPEDFLARGIRVECDHRIDPNSLGESTCFVTLEMPVPFNQADRELWGNEIIGFQPLILFAEVNAENSAISWIPAQPTADWLQNKLFQRMAELQRGDRIRAHLTLKGNFIWALGQPELYLNGEVFGFREPDGTNTDLRLPSGNLWRGGDFEMWFWLVPSTRSAPRLGIEPAALDFGEVRVKSDSTQILTVRNTGDASLNVSKIFFERSLAEFSVTPQEPFTLEREGQKELIVHFSPRTAGDRRIRLIIASNDPGRPTVGVAISGKGITVPQIEVKPPEELNFGARRIGSQLELPLTVSNTGDAPLEVTNLAIKQNTQVFTVLDGKGKPLKPTESFTLNPKQSIKLGVRFTAALGTQTGTLRIQSNDPDHPTVTVKLSGSGRGFIIGTTGPFSTGVIG